MAVKKSELYSRIWAACDELGRGIDPAIYKNYILTLLFIKYVSDKYANDPYATIRIPAGATFAEMSKLKGNPNIGDLINKKIVEPLFSANNLTGYPDFNSSQNLGDGKEKVERLTNLIATFEDPALDFSGNRAENDDLLGDAYEYLMRNFAMETGKSKGQFYTPTEVSRVIAAVVGIHDAATSAQTTIYDPACGSGSLLLRVADAARTPVSVYGQENDVLTAGLVRMNMILHRQEVAEIAQGNSLSNPRFLDGTKLKRFDFVVMNPPFSDKGWIKGVNVENDPYERFAYGVPPTKQGDYAYLLHVLASLKSTGTGVAVMPHGVLFRGNAEATIRENLVKQGLILGIIGLPANLFYGTSIPACLVVLDKATAKNRRGIFMIDASDGFMKDGPKNRLRARDIHKIVDAFTRKADVPGYSRMVPLAEIEANEYNLNLPRYSDSLDKEDLQDIDAHLNAGIPVRDIDALDAYWKVCPDLRPALFTPNREGYVDLAVEKSAIKTMIQEHPQFNAFVADANAYFEAWRNKVVPRLKALEPGLHPKDLIKEISEDLLLQFEGNPLIDGYAVYQHLMDYWDATMQDDCYLIAADGWKAEPHRVIEVVKSGKNKGNGKEVGWACDLVPKEYIVRRYFANDQAKIDDLTSKREAAESQLEEFEGEHSGAEGALDGLKLNKASVARRLKEIERDSGVEDEIAILKQWVVFVTEVSAVKKTLKDVENTLDAAAVAKYPTLSQDEIKTLVVDDKWSSAIHLAIGRELTIVSSALLNRVVALGKRYSTTLNVLAEQERDLEGIVTGHLVAMGYIG